MAERPHRPNRTLTGLRVALGMTQQQYAAAAGVSEREVRDWEAGRVSCPQTWSLQRLHGLHGTSTPEDLGFAGRSRRAHQSAGTVEPGDQTEAAVYRRNLIGLVVAAAFGAQHLPALGGLLAEDEPYDRQVGLGDVERITKANASLTSTDLMVGGAAVPVDVLMRQFRTKSALLYGRFASDATRAATHSAVAHLGSTIAWMMFDQGRHLNSRQMYLASLRIAKGADDTWALRAVICSEMARQARHCRAFEEAEELIGIAHGADSQLPATARAELHAISASIAAANGDRTRTIDQIRRAEDEFGRAKKGTDPAWIAWFTPAELAGDTGEAMAVLAQHHDDLRADAAARLTASARSHQPSAQRSAALTMTRLAELHAADHNPTRAARATHQAVDLAERLRSPRLTETLNTAATTMSPLAAHPDMASAIARIRALTVTA